MKRFWPAFQIFYKYKHLCTKASVLKAGEEFCEMLSAYH